MADKQQLARDKQTTRFIYALFWRAMLQDKKSFTFSLLHIPAFAIGTAYIPFQIAHALQAIIKGQSDLLEGYIIQILISVLVASVVSYIANKYGDCRMAVSGARYVQRQAFANFLNKDYDFYAGQFIGSIGSQVTQLREAFTQFCYEFRFSLLKDVVTVLAFVIILAFNSLQLALMTCMCMAFILGYTFISSRKRLQYRRAASKAGTELSGLEADALSHGAAVKSFAAEGYEQEYLQPAVKKWHGAQLKAFLSLDPANTIRFVLGHVLKQFKQNVSPFAV